MSRAFHTQGQRGDTRESVGDGEMSFLDDYDSGVAVDDESEEESMIQDSARDWLDQNERESQGYRLTNKGRMSPALKEHQPQGLGAEEDLPGLDFLSNIKEDFATMKQEGTLHILFAAFILSCLIKAHFPYLLTLLTIPPLAACLLASNPIRNQSLLVRVPQPGPMYVPRVYLVSIYVGLWCNALAILHAGNEQLFLYNSEPGIGTIHAVAYLYVMILLNSGILGPLSWIVPATSLPRQILGAVLYMGLQQTIARNTEWGKEVRIAVYAVAIGASLVLIGKLRLAANGVGRGSEVPFEKASTRASLKDDGLSFLDEIEKKWKGIGEVLERRGSVPKVHDNNLNALIRHRRRSSHSPFDPETYYTHAPIRALPSYLTPGRGWSESISNTTQRLASVLLTCTLQFFALQLWVIGIYILSLLVKCALNGELYSWRLANAIEGQGLWKSFLILLRQVYLWDKDILGWNGLLVRRAKWWSGWVIEPAKLVLKRISGELGEVMNFVSGKSVLVGQAVR